MYISIHAPAKGATVRFIPWGFEYTDFNPRSREGSDVSFAFFRDFSVISIHAPAKGATTMIRLLESVFGISIHAPAKGATPISTVSTK